MDIENDTLENGVKIADATPKELTKEGDRIKKKVKLLIAEGKKSGNFSPDIPSLLSKATELYMLAFNKANQ